MKKDLGQKQISHDDKAAEQRNHDHDERGGTFQFLPARPGAFLEFLACFRDIDGEALNLSLPPKEAEQTADDHRPNCNMYPVVVHKNLSGLPNRSSHYFPSRIARLRFSAGVLLRQTGGEGGIRTPVGLSPKAVFKTAAIDHSATSPTSQNRLPSRSPQSLPSLSLRRLRRLARREGLEPPTNGFGDHYSTN